MLVLPGLWWVEVWLQAIAGTFYVFRLLSQGHYWRLTYVLIPTSSSLINYCIDPLIRQGDGQWKGPWVCVKNCEIGLRLSWRRALTCGVHCLAFGSQQVVLALPLKSSRFFLHDKDIFLHMRSTQFICVRNYLSMYQISWFLDLPLYWFRHAIQ